jgi:hypothetical protein
MTVNSKYRITGPTRHHTLWISPVMSRRFPVKWGKVPEATGPQNLDYQIGLRNNTGPIIIGWLQWPAKLQGILSWKLGHPVTIDPDLRYFVYITATKCSAACSEANNRPSLFEQVKLRNFVAKIVPTIIPSDTPSYVGLTTEAYYLRFLASSLLPSAYCLGLTT